MKGARAVIASVVAGVLACVLAFVLAGCGVGRQNHAEVIPSGDIPSTLFKPPPASSPPSSPPESVEPSSAAPSSPEAPSSELGGRPPYAPTSSIYLVSGDRLVAEHRSRIQTQTLSGLLGALLQGPTDAELAHGISTAINTAPSLNSATIDYSTGTATIDLSQTFGDIRPPDLKLATAQVVMTTLLYSDVTAVRIQVDGQPASVPLADGTLSSEPLLWSDYASMLAS